MIVGPGTSIDGYFRETSFGKAWAIGTVIGPFTINGTFGCFPDLSQLRDPAVKAASGSLDMHGYNKIVLITRQSPDCGDVEAAGQAIPNCPSFVLPDGSTSYAGVAWGSLVSTRDYREILPTIIHETGHTLGIRNHASSLDFDGVPLGLLVSVEVHDEYGDWFSTMGGFKCVSGSCTHGHFDTEHKLLLGWLDPARDVQVVAGSGTFTGALRERHGCQSIKDSQTWNVTNALGGVSPAHRL